MTEYWLIPAGVVKSRENARVILAPTRGAALIGYEREQQESPVELEMFEVTRNRRGSICRAVKIGGRK